MRVLQAIGAACELIQGVYVAALPHPHTRATMIDVKTLKATLQRELDLLGQLREELRLKAHLAKAEAKTEIDRLETTWLRVQEEIKRVGEHSKESVQEVETTARKLLGELKTHYNRIKQDIESPRS
jgi:multidrug resistance efflux pump